MKVCDTSTAKLNDSRDMSANHPSAVEDSLQVEVGSEIRDQDVTLGMSAREDPIGGEVNSSGIHEAWSPSTR